MVTMQKLKSNVNCSVIEDIYESQKYSCKSVKVQRMKKENARISKVSSEILPESESP